MRHPHSPSPPHRHRARALAFECVARSPLRKNDIVGGQDLRVNAPPTGSDEGPLGTRAARKGGPAPPVDAPLARWRGVARARKRGPPGRPSGGAGAWCLATAPSDGASRLRAGPAQCLAPRPDAKRGAPRRPRSFKRSAPGAGHGPPVLGARRALNCWATAWRRRCRRRSCP